MCSFAKGLLRCPILVQGSEFWQAIHHISFQTTKSSGGVPMFPKTCASLLVQKGQTDGHWIVGIGKQDFEYDYPVVWWGVEADPRLQRPQRSQVLQKSMEIMLAAVLAGCCFGRSVGFFFVAGEVGHGIGRRVLFIQKVQALQRPTFHGCFLCLFRQSDRNPAMRFYQIRGLSENS